MIKSQPVYAPPSSGPPPPEESQTHYIHPPTGPPPDIQPAQSSMAQHNADAPMISDPPPAYTRNAFDPLPAWSSVEFTDLTDSEDPSDLLRFPLDPPPSCFSTPTLSRIHSRSFEPFRVPSRGQSLVDGFRLLYPRDRLLPHGISVGDWTRFLQDLGIAARLSGQGLTIRGEPHSPRMGFFRGRAGSTYNASFARSPAEEVQELIAVWNQSAFERRKLRVTLHPRTGVQAGRREAFELLVEAL
ncbi:hypothetical protein BDY19DRAFT_987443 [Irpex rosettiformis]|uniref:Uncharacterized protein n=1 Tax=Irpex rosettiformis TaxID=378272 RepID=A0ACB8TRJ4_9APHY|nr:hypothetical protein BDY19DRAFT_987443 [Irpex rosettiformis]